MLLCLVISGQLWIGDSQRLFPTQGDYYFHKFQDSITIYSVGGIRRGSVAIPKDLAVALNASSSISEISIPVK